MKSQTTINKLKELCSSFTGDMYEQYLFGELTFTPNGGKDENLPEETDKYFGELIQLPTIK